MCEATAEERLGTIIGFIKSSQTLYKFKNAIILMTLLLRFIVGSMNI